MEQSQVNNYNPNDPQRAAITYATNTIGFLSDIIKKLSNGGRLDMIQNDLEDAKYHFGRLTELIPVKEETNPSNDQ